MKIGNVELENNIFLAPMAGITDLPFRLICKEQGAGLVYTEMVSSKALFYGDEKTKQLLKSSPKERPLAVQIFGSDLETIKYSVKYLNDYADIIDINMGCPAPKIVKNGDGSKILLDLELVKQIVEVAVNNAEVPITVKIRKGWDNEHVVAVEAAKIIENAGASAIAVHGRTRNQFYAGEADWDIIKKVKESVKIPVIGNGDIKSAELAKEMLDYTKVDAVMIGRATMGNPWIFRETLEYLKTGNKIAEPTIDERLEMLLKHLELEIELKGEVVAVKEMRKYISGYTKGLPEASQFRCEINKLQTAEEVRLCVQKYFNNLK